MQMRPRADLIPFDHPPLLSMSLRTSDADYHLLDFNEREYSTIFNITDPVVMSQRNTNEITAEWEFNYGIKSMCYIMYTRE